MKRLAIALAGSTGKMGRMIAQAISETPSVELTATLERAALSQLEQALSGVEAIIDFSAPPVTLALAEQLAASGGPALIIGTTGLGASELAIVDAAAKRVPVVLSANMSLGVNVLFGLLEKAARALPGYDVEIVELHHRLKRDAPSGTALRMAEVVAGALDRELDAAARYGRHGMVGARGAEEIGLHSVRGGDIVGEHTAYFCGLGERLELTHRASSRETFARGAVRAAEWTRGQAPGRYDMQDVLGLRE
jgi:4-hydroxy-tetrahydrodipicolinate reductase